MVQIPIARGPRPFLAAGESLLISRRGELQVITLQPGRNLVMALT